jgi:hypothetical protein
MSITDDTLREMLATEIEAQNPKLGYVADHYRTAPLEDLGTFGTSALAFARRTYERGRADMREECSLLADAADVSDKPIRPADIAVAIRAIPVEDGQ